MTATAIQTFSPEQLEQRRHTLGASEIPVVAGLVPFKSPLQLWAEKRGLVPTFQGNEFTEWGNRLEAVVADKYAEVRGARIHVAATHVHPVDTWMSATPDRLVEFGGAIDRGLEVKCRGEYRGDEWGEPGTDEVPHDVAIQAHWNMMVTGLGRWDVATLIGGNKFRLYELYADADIAANLHEIGRVFWFDHVLAGVEPAIDASAATETWLKKRFGVHGEELREATLEEATLIARLEEVRDERKHIEAVEQGLKNQLMQAIGNAAGISAPCGKVTWKAPASGGVSYKSVVESLVKRFNIPSIEVAEFVKLWTSEPSRRFVPTFPKKR